MLLGTFYDALSYYRLPFNVLQQAINHRLKNILVHILRLNYKNKIKKDNYLLYTVYEENWKQSNMYNMKELNQIMCHPGRWRESDTKT